MVQGKGNRRLQQVRRRKNNKDIPVRDEEYELIDGNKSRQPYAYCACHQAYLTANMAKCHGCKRKQCKAMQILEV